MNASFDMSIMFACTYFSEAVGVSHSFVSYHYTVGTAIVLSVCVYVCVLSGTTLSQLSDSGQTLSEDSGVDIAEAGGMCKDSSPRPSKVVFQNASGEVQRAERAPCHQVRITIR